MISSGAISAFPLSSLASGTFDASANISGAGSGAGSAVATLIVNASISAFGTSSAVGIGLLSGDVLVSGSATVSGASLRVRPAATSVLGAATATASPVNVAVTTASVLGAGTTTSVANAITPVTTNISGTATSAPAGGSFVGNPTETINGVATTVGVSTVRRLLSASVQGNAQITGGGLRIADGHSTVNGVATTSIFTILIQGAFGNLSGLASGYGAASLFNYYNLRDAYDRKRLVYIERQLSSVERTVNVANVVRFAWIGTTDNSQDRTVMVEKQSRVAYSEPQTTAFERTVRVAA